LQYFCQNANVSALLCTATQPGFDRLKPEYALQLSASNEIIPELARHFSDLKRVELIDNTRPGGRTLDGAADFIEKLPEQSILTVVNTKPQARKVYANLSKKHPDWEIVHLSTNMCPAHRRKTIANLKEVLLDKTKKCICISTRLIEAGVDIDFDAAIRFFAGLDSIIQTAGRCNRNGQLKDANGNYMSGKTYIINIVQSEENLGSLEELKLGQSIMERVLREYHDDESLFDNTILHPNLIAKYFSYFYGQLPDSLLKYKVFPGRDDTMLDLLSTNAKSISEFSRIAESKYKDTMPQITEFHQSFESAWKAFEVIASGTIGVIVPFERGTDIIAELYALPDIKHTVELLHEAQQYSVNVYYNKLSEMIRKKIVRRVTTNTEMEIYAVEEGYYDEHTGLSDEFGGLTTPYV
jgi:CRISPR-associated endonuclease/helicase Cas3